MEDTVRSQQGAFLTEAATAAPNKEKDTNSDLEEEDDQQVNVVEEIQKSKNRDVVDLILVWEDAMTQMIYADKEGYYIYNEEIDGQS